VPVVALLRPPFELHPDPREGDRDFRGAARLHPRSRHHRRETKQLKNGMRTFFVLPYETRRIWGANRRHAGPIFAEVLAPASGAR